MYKGSTRQDGFTIIELLTVIAVIGLLASIITTTVGTVRSKARDAKRLGNLKALTNALELYLTNNNSSYPPAGCDGDGLAEIATCCSSWGLGNGWISGLAPTYMSALPHDPLEPPTAGGPDICYARGVTDGSGYKFEYRLENRDDQKALGQYVYTSVESGITVYRYDFKLNWPF